MFHAVIRPSWVLLSWLKNVVDPSVIVSPQGITIPYPRGCSEPITSDLIIAHGNGEKVVVNPNGFMQYSSLAFHSAGIFKYLFDTTFPNGAALNAAFFEYRGFRVKYLEEFFGQWVAVGCSGDVVISNTEVFPFANQ
jgi:hypothetical protein